MENCLLLGASYVDKAIRLDDQSDLLLPTLRKAQGAYFLGLKIYTRSQRLSVPDLATSLLESPATDLQHIWEFLAYEDEPTHTQTLDILQRLTVHRSCYLNLAFFSELDPVFGLLFSPTWCLESHSLYYAQKNLNLAFGQSLNLILRRKRLFSFFWSPSGSVVEFYSAHLSAALTFSQTVGNMRFHFSLSAFVRFPMF
jgi:hypothetical protein